MCLYRNNHLICRRQYVQRNHPQRRRTVNENVVILPFDFIQIHPQHRFSAHRIYQNNLHPRKLNIGRYQVHPFRYLLGKGNNQPTEKGQILSYPPHDVRRVILHGSFCHIFPFISFSVNLSLILLSFMHQSLHISLTSRWRIATMLLNKYIFQEALKWQTINPYPANR